MDIVIEAASHHISIGLTRSDQCQICLLSRPRLSRSLHGSAKRLATILGTQALVNHSLRLINSFKQHVNPTLFIRQNSNGDMANAIAVFTFCKSCSRESQVNCNTGPIVTSHVTLPHLVQAGFLIAIISIFYGAASEKKSS